MKSFLKLFIKSIPLGFGIALALISIAYIVSIIDSIRREEEIIAAIFFGIIGFPMAIAGAINLIKDLNIK